MSLKSMTLLCHSCALGISIAIVQSSYAENIHNFESALAKVQRYQAQDQLWQQSQNIAALNIRQSQLRQNPSLNIEQSGFTSNQEQELNIGISQALDLFGQRKLNQVMANKARQKIQLQQQLLDAQSELIVKFAWAQFALSDVEKSIYASQLKVSQANVESAEKRYQAGSIALVDYERAQINALDVQRLSQQSILTQQVAKHQLANLWGGSLVQFQLNQNTIPWPEQAKHTVQYYISEGWLEKLYALNVQQSDHQLEYLKILSRPQPTINLGMKRTKTPDENNDTALTMGVNVPLNLFNRQQYSIPIAQQQAQLLNQQQQRELKQQLLDIANQLQQLDGLSQQFEATTAQIHLAEKIQHRSLQGFQAGKMSITDVQQATTQLQNLRLGQLQILRQAWQNALSAEALSIGTSYEDISRSDAYTQLHKKMVQEIQNLANDGV